VSTAKYPNYWPGWEQDVLKAAGLPVTSANVTYLANWHAYEGSAAANNPLNTTAYAADPETVGYKTLNSAGVQYYATTAQGAAATAAFLKMPNFSAIFSALQSGDPYHYTAESQSKLNDFLTALKKWGSNSFAAVYAYEAPSTSGGLLDPSTSQTNSNPETGGQTSTTNNPPSVTGWLSDIESWLTDKGKLVLAYVLLVGVAGGLLLTGMKGLGMPTPKAAPVPVPV